MQENTPLLQEVNGFQFSDVYSISQPIYMPSTAELYGTESSFMATEASASVEVIPTNSALVGKTTFAGLLNCSASLVKNDDGLFTVVIELPTQDLTLGSIFTQLQHTSASQIAIENGTISFEQNKQADSIAGTVTLAGYISLSSEPFKVIANTLGITNNVFVRGSLSVPTQALAKPLQPSALTLASVVDYYFELQPGVTLTKTIVEIALQNIGSQHEPATWACTVVANGLLLISQFTSKQPAVFEAQICLQQNQVLIQGKAENLISFLGLEGVNLTSATVSFIAGVGEQIQVQALWQTPIGLLSLIGSINNNNVGVHARLSSCSMQQIQQLANHVLGFTIPIPELPLVFENLVIGLATEAVQVGEQLLPQGLSLQAECKIENIACKITGTINKEGFSAKASIGNLELPGVCIQNATLQLDCLAASMQANMAIWGEVEIKGVKAKAKLCFELQNEQYNLVLYGILQAETFALSNLFPDVKDTLVDGIRFSQLAFILATADGVTQDEQYKFSVKKGLQLMATVSELPGLAQLTQGKQLNVALSAYLGTSVQMSMALPDTKISLGPNVETSPFKIVVALLPRPSIQLVFGVNVLNINPQPLQFDVALTLDVMGATGSGTMRGWLIEPFGIKGLQIGPNMAMQVGIDYVQFANTGTPAQLGLAGGLALGEVQAQMAINLASDPSKLILLGEVERLTVQNLVDALNNSFAANISIENIPNYIELNHVKLYVAPAGGSIGTIEFEQGFSLIGNTKLLNKTASFHGSISANGLLAKGFVDYLEIGSLLVTGKYGTNLQYNFQLTTAQQAITADGEIQLFGSNLGTFLHISSKQVKFHFDLSIAQLFNVTVFAESKGSLAEFWNADFSLLGTFDDKLTTYLVETISGRLQEVSTRVNTSLSQARQKVNEARLQYNNEMQAAQDEVATAKQNADALLQTLHENLQQQTKMAAHHLEKAQQELQQAEANFYAALVHADAEVARAQNAFDTALHAAVARVNDAEAAYNNELNSALYNLRVAEESYHANFAVVNNALHHAQMTVNNFQWEIDVTQNEIRGLHWYEGYKMIYLAPRLAGLFTQKGVADAALHTARFAVDTFATTSSFIAFETARTAVHLVQTGGSAIAFSTAKQVLHHVQTAGEYLVLQNARAALEFVKVGSEQVIWQTAKANLTNAEQFAAQAVANAQNELANYGSAALVVAFSAAQATLQEVQSGVSHQILQTAEDTLQAVQMGNQSFLEVSNAIVQAGPMLVQLHKGNFSGLLSEIKKGKLFTASIHMQVLHHELHENIALDVQDIKTFVTELYELCLNKLKGK